jgi:hypothetical protein
MQITVEVEGSQPEVMALHAFFVANEDAFPCTEDRRQIEDLLMQDALVMLGGGASPLVRVWRNH